MPINDHARGQIIEALELGMPMPNVADYVELELSVIQREMREDAAFKARVNKAIADCMYKRLKALAGLENWQALAFILTSLWPARFGRHSRGVPKLAKLLDKPHFLDFSRLDKYELVWFDYLMAKLNGKNPLRPAERGHHRTVYLPESTAD